MRNKRRLAFSPILLTSIGFVGAIVIIAIIAFQLREPRDNLRSTYPAETAEVKAVVGAAADFEASLAEGNSESANATTSH